VRYIAARKIGVQRMEETDGWHSWKHDASAADSSVAKA